MSSPDRRSRNAPVLAAISVVNVAGNMNATCWLPVDVGLRME